MEIKAKVYVNEEECWSRKGTTCSWFFFVLSSLNINKFCKALYNCVLSNTNSNSFRRLLTATNLWLSYGINPLFSNNYTIVSKKLTIKMKYVVQMFTRLDYVHFYTLLNYMLKILSPLYKKYGYMFSFSCTSPANTC